MAKRILDCAASDFARMTKEELLFAIGASEGRTLACETIGTVTPLLGDVTNGELAVALGADILLLNLFDVDCPQIQGLPPVEPMGVIREVKRLTGRPVGINLEPVEVGAGEVDSLWAMTKGRMATLENAQRAADMGVDFILLTGNPGTGVTNRAITDTLELFQTHLGDRLILAEGYMDVIAMHQAGFTNAVASLGTALTSQQCSLMKRFTNEVLVIYDSDGAGVKAALRAIPLLREAGLSTKVIDLSPYKDPDEFIKAEGAEAFEERLERGVNGFLYEVDKLQLNYDMEDPQGKTDFLHEAARRLCRLGDEIERNTYLEAIAGRYGIGIDILRKLVNRLAMQGAGIEPRPQPVTTGARPSAVKPSGGADMAQRLMLTWLASYPSIYEGVKQYISLDDFTEPMYRRMAGLLFEQYDTGEPNPAGILSHFEDVEEQKRAAAVLHAGIRLDSDEERQQALKDVIFRIKSDSLKKRMARGDPSDPESLTALMREKKELEEFRVQTGKLHISIN